MSCSSCGYSAEKKENQYKCKSCGSVSKNEVGECCGISREKVCSCGSGKYAKECCQV